MIIYDSSIKKSSKAKLYTYKLKTTRLTFESCNVDEIP